MMKNQLIISEIINKKSAVLHSDGLKLFEAIFTSYNESEKLEILFNGLEYCTSAFLNASIGKFLLETNNPEIAAKKIEFPDLKDELIRKKIEEVYALALDEKKRVANDQYLREEIYA